MRKGKAERKERGRGRTRRQWKIKTKERNRGIGGELEKARMKNVEKREGKIVAKSGGMSEEKSEDHIL